MLACGRKTLLSLLAVLLIAGAAEGAVLRGAITGGKLPSASSGQTVIRAVNMQTSEIRAATTVPRSGKWSLTVPPGPYSLLTTVVTGKALKQAISPIVRAKRGVRVQVPVSLRRVAAPRRRVKERTRALHTTLAGPIVAVRKLTTTGPHPELGHGFSDMFVTDFFDDANRCKPTVVEWEKRKLMQQELDLGPLAAGPPLRKRWIQPQVFVEGSLTTTPEGLGSWDVRVRDAKTGEIVGGDHGTMPPGGDAFEAAHQIAERIVDQLCGGTYDVTIQLATDNVQAAFNAHGTIGATLVATGSAPSPRIPPTRFTGSAPISYGSLAFAATIPNCTIGGASSDQGSVNVTLEVTTAGRLRVTWIPSPLSLAAHATMTCQTSGGPFTTPVLGPGIAGVAPTSFELPVSGGSQTITGVAELNSGGLGIFHSGMIVVTRRPPS